MPRAGSRGARTAPADPPSFRALYEAEFRGILASLIALTGDRGVAEELAQEAFARAFRDWADVSGYERPGAWVRTVALNLARSRFRRLAAEARALVRLRGQRQVDVTLPERDERFWAEVRRLPARQAQALVLHYVEDLPIADIALVMECAAGTAKVHLHRGRRNLADRLGIAAPIAADDRTEETDR